MKRFILLILFLICLPLSGAEDDKSEIVPKRTENLNVLFILDVSTSMRPFFREIQDYLNNALVKENLIQGDYLYFYTFGQYIIKRTEGILVPGKEQALTLEIPKERTLLEQEKLPGVINKISPVEEATDIGLALEALDIILKEGLPYRDSIIFFITDGRNDPHPSSPYLNKDIYAEGAFEAYNTIKEGPYKVMFLSIGEKTDAEKLAGSLGGQIIKIDSDLTSEKLSDAIRDFDRTIKMYAPGKIDKVEIPECAIPVSFTSNYNTDTEMILGDFFYTLDDGEQESLPLEQSRFIIKGGRRIEKEFLIPLPETITEGPHTLVIKLFSENVNLAGSVRTIHFNYTPFPLLGLILFILILWIVLALFFYLVLRKK